MLTTTSRTYSSAGIKVNTPGYVLSNCRMDKNGYCLFSVSNNQAAIIPITTAPTCQADVITFSPAVTQVNNPIGSTLNAPQQFTINMTVCDAHGKPLIPSMSNPIHIAVYGAPDGVISPTSATSITWSVTFTYSGASFTNNISINALISDRSNHGAALGVTQVLQQHKLACTYGSTSYQVPLEQTLPYPLRINADVGYDVSSSTDSLTHFTIDTGSLGVIVPTHELPKNGNVIGPGAPGVKYYSSSCNTYSGHYYLAPVRIKTASGVVQTYPIMVLGIDKAYCHGPLNIYII